MSDLVSERMYNDIDGAVDWALNGENTHTVLVLSKEREYIFGYEVAVGGKVETQTKALQRDYILLGTIDLSEEFEPQREKVLEKLRKELKKR